MNNNKIIILALLTWSSMAYALKNHTIYLSGPPSHDNINWHKESRYIYKGLKAEIIDQGNSIELFPKRKYRGSITRKSHIRSHSMPKKKLLVKYRDLDALFNELLELIIKRRDEIIAINSSAGEIVCDPRLHLRSHGNGDILMSMLIDNEFGHFLGSLISIEGNGYVSHTDLSTASISEIISSDPRVSQEVCNGSTIINITINELAAMKHTSVEDDDGCSTQKTMALIGAMLGIVGAILALL